MNVLFDVAVVIIKTIVAQTTIFLFSKITTKKDKKKTTRHASNKTGRSSKRGN
ncbi:hypothetical protein [Bacillus salipaludis]|uniref:hypothetical protein n=1 Tax=Bacillus salipaludis TaxID=2547811 RepID=UPI002E21A0BC|nr:hypothetical protein [Bacillus salipaludis]